MMSWQYFVCNCQCDVCGVCGARSSRVGRECSYPSYVLGRNITASFVVRSHRFEWVSGFALVLSFRDGRALGFRN